MNNQPKKYNKFIAASLVALLVGLVLTTVTYALTKGRIGVYKNQTGWHYAYDAEKDSYKEGTMSLERFENISIDISLSNLILEPSDKYELEYSYFEDQGAFTFSQKDSTLLISQKKSQGLGNLTILNIPIAERRNKIILRYPKDTVFSTVSIKKFAGNCTIQGVSAKTFSMESEFGTTILEEITGDTIQITTDSGTNTLSNITGDSLTLDTNFGTNTLKQITVKDKMVFHSESGTIHINGLKADILDFTSEFGSINGKDLDLQGLNLDSTSGTINLEGKLGEKTSIRSAFGNIKLKIQEKREEYALEIQREFGSIKVDGNTIGGNISENTTAKNTLSIHSDSGEISINFQG